MVKLRMFIHFVLRVCMRRSAFITYSFVLKIMSVSTVASTMCKISTLLFRSLTNGSVSSCQNPYFSRPQFFPGRLTVLFPADFNQVDLTVHGITMNEAGQMVVRGGYFDLSRPFGQSHW